MSIEEQVAHLLTHHLKSVKGHLDAVIAGVSGGVDSMVLVDLLDRLRSRFAFELVVCHVHHGLRGAEADRDAQVVDQWAQTRKISVHIEYVDVPANRQTGESDEMAARRLRYDALCKVADAYGRSFIMTAHHANDQAETILDRFLRGTGPSGLRGMQESRSIGRHILLRPLLTLYKTELLRYAEERGISYVEDSTNEDKRYRRNRIRRELLPYLREAYNPRMDRSLVQLGQIMADEDHYLSDIAHVHALALVRHTADGVSMSLHSLRRLPTALQRRVIKLVLEGIDENVAWQFADIEAVLALAPSERKSRMMLPHGWIASAVFDILHIGRFKSPGEPKELPWSPFLLDWSSFFSFLRFHWEVEMQVVGRPKAFAASHWKAFFERQEEEKFIFRPWMEGDRIEPLGMKGSKLVSDLFVEGKIARELRPFYPLLLCADEILWVPGLCRSRSHLVDKHTALVQQIVVRR